MNKKTILILGGGTGGVITANELRRKLGNNHRIVIIDKNEDYVFEPSLLWLMVGERKAERISRSRRELEKKGIEFVNGEIESIQPGEKAVHVDGKTFIGDYIVISLGADLHEPDELKSCGHNFYSLEGAQAFWEQVQDFKGGKVVVLVSSMPFKCPAAPYEAAMLIESYFRKNKLRDDVELKLYSPETGPMGVAGKEVSEQVRQMVEAKGIKFYPEHQWVNTENETLHFKNGAHVIPDLLAYVPQHRCPTVLHNAGLTNDSNWVKVDKYTLETDFPCVFSIGDANNIGLDMGKPLPKAGVFAHNQAVVVAKNIVADIQGKKRSTVFNGDGECFVETGDGKAGFGKGDFYAEPTPKVTLYQPGKHWHQGKLLFEKDFLRNFNKTGPVLDKFSGFIKRWL